MPSVETNVQTASSRTANSIVVSTAGVGDYYALLKPRVMRLVVFTGAVGYLMAPATLHPVLGMIAIFALALGAGAAGAMNMVYERELDARMKRTRNRPLPRGVMRSDDALAFAMILAAASLVLMWLAAGILSALLLAGSIFFYAVIYTILLKPNTPQNIVIGGAAGAFPPLIGWVAATGTMSWDAVVMFAIVFLWTPPHFWALALFSQDDYASVGLPMLPNTHGVAVTKQHILAYTVLLFPMAMMPYFLGMVAELYLVASMVLGAMFVWKAFRLFYASDIVLARRLFWFSIVYLFALFGALLLDKYAYILWRVAQ